MRVGLLLSGLALLFPASAPAQPDPVLYEATVAQPVVQVRCLPSDAAQAYPTNSLRTGATVRVVEVLENGWLKILPPPGSWSWINQRFVQQLTTNNPVYVVKTAANVNVPVLIGSDQNGNTEPTTNGASLIRGTQVVSLGVTVTNADGSWLRIEPPVGEYRYIRANAVTRTNGVVPPAQTGPSPFNPARPETTVAGSPGTGGANFQQPALTIPGATPSAPGGGNIPERARLESVYNQAVQADRAGQTATAIALYTQVGAEGAVVHQDLAMQALNRAYALRTGTRGQTVQGQPTRAGSLPERPSQFTPQGGTPPPNPYPEAVTTVNRPGSVGGYPFKTGPGVLHPSTQRVLEGRQVYLMLHRNGSPISYVTGGPGIDLGQYVGREVEMFGQAVYRGDLKTNLMVVERVQVGR